MNLTQIKNDLGIPSLQLHTAQDAEGNNTEWFRHWDNENRVAVSIHKDLVAELKEKKNKITSLAMQTSTLTGEQGDYTAKRIVKYNEAEEVL